MTGSDNWLSLLEQRLADDRHLAVFITTSAGSAEPQVSVVNAAVIAHPTSGERVIALVARRGAKLTNLRRHAHATIVARAGWEWAAASGPVELSGPDDPNLAIDPETRCQLLRDIYHAAGGHHPDLDAYDRIMLDERRCAVIIHSTRTWTNPAGSDHLEPQDTQ